MIVPPNAVRSGHARDVLAGSALVLHRLPGAGSAHGHPDGVAVVPRASV